MPFWASFGAFSCIFDAGPALVICKMQQASKLWRLEPMESGQQLRAAPSSSISEDCQGGSPQSPRF